MPLFERDEAEYTSEAHAQALTGTPVENAFVGAVYEKLSGVYDLTFGPLLHPGRLFAKDRLGKQTAESIAMKVKGVKSVQNHIAVRP